jgi:DNA-binding SARP family transcriptional activator/tetratricopeptide (TPR) repeat protein
VETRTRHEPLLTARLFGVPHVSYGERAVHFVPARALSLFAYLLLHRERPIPRDVLCYAFWPDCTDADARSNLRRHLHRVNAALPAIAGITWLETTYKTVGLHPEAPIDLDVARLEAAVAGTSGAEAALDLYAGDLFEGCDDEWILSPRERLRSRYLDLAAATIGRYRGERRFAEAIALTQRMRDLDPLREDAARLAMALRYEAGDRAGALREFESFRALLRSEIGATPMHETLSLHDVIRRHGALDAADTPAVSASYALPFEGRESELATLRHVWQRAARGAGQLAFVSGEAGIGKTRLLREFSLAVEREGGRVLAGRSSAPETRPYEPLVDALRLAAAEIARLPLAPAMLGALTVQLPELRALRPDLPDIVELAGERERARFFDAVGLVLAALASHRPTVLLVEDLHAAREGTLDLLAAIVRTCAGAPLLVVASYREEETSAALRALLHASPARSGVRLGLARLTPEACAAILTGGYRNDVVPAAMSEWATRVSGGNPLFLGELVRDCQARIATGESPAAVPSSLEATIAARISRMSEQTRKMTGVAAVAGLTFSVDVIHRASGWPLAEVLDAVDELVNRFVVRETATGSAGDYQFAHELIRNAVLVEMPSADRARRHRRVARALLEVFPQREEELAGVLAEHFARAGLARESAAYYTRAARTALAQFAWREAIALGERALEQSNRGDERFALFDIVCSANEMLAERREQERAIEAMSRIAQERDDDALRAVVRVRRIELAAQTGDGAVERGAIEELGVIAERLAAPRVQREFLRARARRSIHDGKALAAAERAAAIERIEGLERSAAETIADLALLAHAETLAAAFDRAHAAVRLAQTIAERDGGLGERLAALRMRMHFIVERGEHAEAIRSSPELLELCRSVGDVEGEANAHQNAARATWWDFDVAATREHLRAAAAIFERIGKTRSIVAVLINAGALENHLGLLDEAEEYYTRARACAVTLAAPYFDFLCEGNFAYLAYGRGDHERALLHAQRSLQIARDMADRKFEAIALTHCGTAYRELQRADTAFEYFSQALALCDEFAFADERREAHSEFLPVLVARGDPERAVAIARELVAAIEADSSAVVMPVEALGNAAAALAAAGETANAERIRAQARTLLQERLARLPDARTRAAYAALRSHQPFLAEPAR